MREKILRIDRFWFDEKTPSYIKYLNNDLEKFNMICNFIAFKPRYETFDMVNNEIILVGLNYKPSLSFLRQERERVEEENSYLFFYKQ